MVLTVLSGLLVVFGAGCIFSPPTKPPDPKVKPLPIYPIRNTPKRAVLYLKAAWENRDSTRADTVYALNYTGISSQEGVADLKFAKSDEVRALGGVQISREVTSVLMDLGDSTNWIRQIYSTDSSTWVSYSILSPRIEVDDQIYGQQIANQSTSFEFTMRPYTVPPGDTLWQIVRWTEQNPPPTP